MTPYPSIERTAKSRLRLRKSVCPGLEFQDLGARGREVRQATEPGPGNFVQTAIQSREELRPGGQPKNSPSAYLLEAGMIWSSRQALIDQGTDWRFLNESEWEIKA